MILLPHSASNIANHDTQSNDCLPVCPSVYQND